MSQTAAGAGPAPLWLPGQPAHTGVGRRGRSGQTTVATQWLPGTGAQSDAHGSPGGTEQKGNRGP